MTCSTVNSGTNQAAALVFFLFAIGHHRLKTKELISSGRREQLVHGFL